jgi:solute carrier family 35 (UDP-galactose transporter), member B1
VFLATPCYRLANANQLSVHIETASLFYVAAMTSSNISMRFVSYPTAVLAKSCKLIPTMVMGSLIERKSYSSSEWLAAGCITSGIVLFNLSRLTSKNDDRENSVHGLLLLVFSLVCDGLLGSCQGLLKRTSKERRPPTAVETMLYVNLYAILFLAPMAHWSGEWKNGMERLDEVQRVVLCLNAAAAAGQIFIFLTITWFSPLVCTTVTTTRKFFTILLSVMHFGHVVTTSQWASVGLVFGGLFVGIQSKTSSASKAKKE